jgi:hypothetical protein
VTPFKRRMIMAPRIMFALGFKIHTRLLLVGAAVMVVVALEALKALLLAVI